MCSGLASNSIYSGSWYDGYSSKGSCFIAYGSNDFTGSSVELLVGDAGFIVVL